VQQLQLPYRFLYLAVLLLCAIGSYTVANSPVAVLLAALFSVLGYAFKRLEPAPMILGFLLGPQMEDNVRRAMRVSSGDPMLFLEPQISLTLVVATAVLLALIVLPAIRAGRAEAFQKVG
jgi:putative tricarboxylic transport membrane protein